jgi:hypothetical protein
MGKFFFLGWLTQFLRSRSSIGPLKSVVISSVIRIGMKTSDRSSFGAIVPLREKLLFEPFFLIIGIVFKEIVGKSFWDGS